MACHRLPSKTKYTSMPTISFKADVKFRDTVQTLAQKKGINTSAYIKLLLTKEMNNALSEITENGLTVDEEMRLLHEDAHDQEFGPFTTTKGLMRALKK